MELYVQQTVPVLQAHLKMAESESTSPRQGTEDPANNKSTTGGMGSSTRND